jgi:hypothetical protein
MVVLTHLLSVVHLRKFPTKLLRCSHQTNNTHNGRKRPRTTRGRSSEGRLHHAFKHSPFNEFPKNLPFATRSSKSPSSEVFNVRQRFSLQANARVHATIWTERKAYPPLALAQWGTLQVQLQRCHSSMLHRRQVWCTCIFNVASTSGDVGASANGRGCSAVLSLLARTSSYNGCARGLV